MCRKAICDTCKKATWWGCGAHIVAVMDSISAEERCTCIPTVEVNGQSYPPKAKSPSF